MRTELSYDLTDSITREVSRLLDIPHGSMPHDNKDVELLKVLDSDDNMVSYEANALKLLRTVCKYRYKLKTQPTREQTEQAKEGFLGRNRRCRPNGHSDFRAALDACSYRTCTLSPTVYALAIARTLVQTIVWRYRIGDPSHGPGTTFFKYDTVLDKYRYLERDVPDRLWRRHSDYFQPSPGFERIEPLGGRSSCRLACVPKDARGPRLVAPHAASAMWMQQAVREGLERAISHTPWMRTYCLPLGEDVCPIQFDDQSINQALAMYASENPTMYATMDLKDASDLVSWSLVAFLFGGSELFKDLDAVRANEVVSAPVREKLWMHAPMGSATCFPVMALSLWALAQGAMFVTRYGIREDLREAIPGKDSCFVFGDDIILPVWSVDAVRSLLSSVGLAVNMNKTFRGLGGFRESCGVDAYRGSNITPILLRRCGVSSIEDTCSLIAHCGHLRSLGLDATADLLERRLVDTRFYREGAVSVAYSSDPDEHSLLPAPDLWSAIRANRALQNRVRWNAAYQRMEVLVLRPRRQEVRESNEMLDSRARAYIALAEKRQGKPARLRPDHVASNGWLSNESQVRRIWVRI